MDYSHPRFYFVIGLLGLLISVATGMTLSRGFYFGVLGLSLFPLAYNIAVKDYDRTERNLLMEIGLSLLGFVFLPVGYFMGIYSSITPTLIDVVFFIIGFSAMALATTLLYLFEPDTPLQSLVVVAVSSLLLVAIIVLIKLYTIGGYLGGFV